MLRDANGIATQLGHIVAFQLKDVPLRILLRQDERLVGMSGLIEVGDEGTRVVAILAATADYEPLTIARP